jgi:hypothetical protein
MFLIRGLRRKSLLISAFVARLIGVTYSNQQIQQLSLQIKTLDPNSF